MAERKAKRNDQIMRDKAKGMTDWEICKKHDVSPYNLRRILVQERRRKELSTGQRRKY